MPTESRQAMGMATDANCAAPLVASGTPGLYVDLLEGASGVHPARATRHHVVVLRALESLHAGHADFHRRLSAVRDLQAQRDRVATGRSVAQCVAHVGCLIGEATAAADTAIAHEVRVLKRIEVGVRLRLRTCRRRSSARGSSLELLVRRDAPPAAVESVKIC